MKHAKLKPIILAIASSKYSVLIALALFTLFLFWPVIHNDFIYNFDDAAYVTGNPHVKSGITLNDIRWAFTSFYAHNWHPITWLSHMLDCQLFGLNAGMHHFTNLVLHIFNILLLFIFLYITTGQLWHCAFVAALFALHPLHVESVAWVAERKDVLSAFFWMLTIISYCLYAKKKSIRYYALSLIFYSIGLMAKPMVVTLPFVLLLLDYWPLYRTPFNQKVSDTLLVPPNKRKKLTSLLLEKAPFFMLSAAASYITIMAQSDVGEGLIVKSLLDFPLNLRINNALISYVHYIVHIFWPLNLGVYYPYPADIPMYKVILSLLILVFLSVYCLRYFKSHPYLTVGWLWYLGTLVPVIGLVQVAEQAIADRYTYIPSIGIFIMLSWSIPEIFKKMNHKKIFVPALIIAILIVLSVLTRIQLSYWKNSKTLFHHTIEVTINNYVTHYALGRVYYSEGDTVQALNQYHEAIKIKPDFSNAHFHSGLAFVKLGKIDEAIVHFNEVLKVDPYYVPAHCEIAFILKEKGKFKEAIDHFRKALEGNPLNENIHNYLGLTLMENGNNKESIEHFRKVLEINQNSAEAHNNLGLALFEEGNMEEAIFHFREAQRILPDNIRIKENLLYALEYFETLKLKKK